MRTLPSLLLILFVPFLPALSAQTSSQKKDPPTTPKTSLLSELRWPEKVAGRTLDDWHNRLKSRDPEIRRDAVRAVLHFGPAATVTVPDIIHIADLDRDISPRVNAIIVLMLLRNSDYIKGKDVSSAVQVLKRRLSDDYQAVVRLHAALALGSFGYEAKDAIPSLVRACRDGASAEIRRYAVGSLGKVGVDKNSKTPDPRASDAVLYVLRTGPTGLPIEPSAKVRVEAVMVLGAMGRPVNKVTQTRVLGTLKSRLRDPDKSVAVWAYVALMALENTVTEANLKGIAKLLKHRDVDVRENAARALGQLGGYANKEHIKLVKVHIPDLLEVLKDPEAKVVSMSCWALGQIGRNTDVGEEASKALTKLAKKQKGDVGVILMARAALDSIKGKKDMKELKDIKKDIDKEKEKDKKSVKP